MNVWAHQLIALLGLPVVALGIRWVFPSGDDRDPRLVEVDRACR